MNNFLALLFSEAAVSCYTESPHGYKVKTGPAKEDLFFCINELYPDRDNNPTKDWHDRNVPRRADANVCTFRNFLIEIDKMDLSDQIAYVRSRVPVSSIVYSGSASYHFIISLEQALPDYETYMHWSKRLLQLLPEADKMCKNPSRLSRLPYRLRPQTGKEQALIYLGTRIPNAELNARLPDEPKFVRPERTQDEIVSYNSPLISQAQVYPDKLMQERGIQSRNGFFYYLGCRMDELEYDQEKRFRIVQRAYESLYNTTDFTLEEALMAARVLS